MLKPPDLIGKLMQWERTREPTRKLHQLLTPPYRAAAMSETQMLPRVRDLLDAGARPNARRAIKAVFPLGTNGVLPPLRQSNLAMAATLGYPEVTKLLLKGGARPDKSAVALLVDNINAVANFESWESPRGVALTAVAEILASAPAENGLWDTKFSQAIFEHRNASDRPAIPARKIVENYCPNAAGYFSSPDAQDVSHQDAPLPTSRRQARM
jgi:hypothetical protein